ncbi:MULTISPECIES: crotonase/enoyl-CoA hydratase family protein [Gordonia]|uniref:Putative enoyl-CoA hydratase n=1 Tax=Gordonia alkanivorans NBRC 16433 TaxID=1027371 RepID=F9VS33_9ACTN|nr:MULTISPECIES: crotonase/enoyl-CoA hydratase family protein [Gordonia]MDH3013212.1 crotonase/enoyl-CoA hydratase family protein [Gordonia alkanivorans]MDH3020612.1 crotonase/enoyl-CoA hydratase family protein [Gordonia alkanivorans]MDH3045157.1 crotonase/enoyl-CoA hydratase family protein [Gordonia alkanivorans]MDJ0007378.1 crotonase/enoyl-CoA hydratase family protein [Gordonia alkanivorans]MDJ0099844.1 crotonase/enoyl-CoA hydratase family protein [Gordonia alkanivorans]
MTEQRILLDVDDAGVATVTLNRADKHNALDPAMFDALLAVTGDLAADRRVRAVVVHGAGKSFCSGLDISSLGGDGLADSLLDRDDADRGNQAQRVSLDWGHVPAPVITAIHGNCFGGGLQIALGADIRYATPDARLSIMEVKWGLVPDMGITQTLPRLLRADVAKELTFTGRVLSGAEAHELGLVTGTADDPLACALDLAHQIAAKSPHAVRAAKRLYDETWTGTDPSAALLLESTLQVELIGSPNQLEAVHAGLARREPRFTDPD